MSSILVVVAYVVCKKPLEMALIEGDDMIEQVAPATTHPPLSDSVLPRTSEGGADRLCAQRFHSGQDFKSEFGVAIKGQVLGRRMIRESLAQLLHDPSAGRVPGHVAVQDSPTVVANDEKAIQNTERESGNGEEVHGGDRFAVIVNKGLPPSALVRGFSVHAAPSGRRFVPKH